MKRLFIILLLLLLSGCYDYRELNDIYIVSGISIDKIDDKYIATVEILDTKSLKLVKYSGDGLSLADAFLQIEKDTSKEIYMGHLDVLIIDDDIMKEDITSIIEFFLDRNDIGDRFYVLIGKDIVIDNSKDIFDSLENNNKHIGSVNLVNFRDLINCYLNPNIDLAIPSIERVNEKFNISSIGVFRNNKLVGYLNEEDGIIYNLIMNNISNVSLKIRYDNDNYIANIVNARVKVTISNNHVNINLFGTIKDNSIDSNINEDISDMIYNSIYGVINRYDSDIYGFGDIWYKNRYEKILLSDIIVSVKSDIMIRNGDIYVK